MKRLHSSALILIILLSVTIIGCRQQERPAQARLSKGNVSVGGTLRIPISSVSADHSPIQMHNVVSNAVGVHIHDGLVRLHPETAELIPGLAESWSAVEGGSAYVFNLRKGVLFHASEWFGNRSREVTARDVEYSFALLTKGSDQQLFEATFGARVVGAEEFRVGEAAELSGVSVVDDYTLRIELEKPDESFLRILAMPAFGVIPKGLFEEDKPNSIGVGPFMPAQIGAEVLLVRNPDYYAQDEFGNGYPYLDSLVFVPIGQNTDKLEAFFNDEVDLVSNLELDPIRDILEEHVPEFSGKTPKYVLKRETDNASYDTYSVYHSKMKNLSPGFMGYRDFSRVQVEQ